MARIANSKQQVPTLERIRTASVALIFERGYHGTSMRHVAAEVGIQMSSLYHYFPSKQSLLMDIMDRTMDDLIINAKAAISKDSTPREKLIAGITEHVNFHAENHMENFITDSELRSLDGNERLAIIAKRDEYSSLFQTVIEDGQSSGEFRKADISVVLAALFSMISSVPTWFKPSGRLSLDSVAVEIATIFLDGLERKS